MPVWESGDGIEAWRTATLFTKVRRWDDPDRVGHLMGPPVDGMCSVSWPDKQGPEAIPQAKLEIVVRKDRTAPDPQEQKIKRLLRDAGIDF